jgi:biopolymer transport protein ExbD
MKFPRNARIAKGSLEAAPWAAVMFLLVIFLMLGALLYTPGVHIQLPEANNLPGTDHPTITVAMDANGRLFFQNQLIQESRLRECLAEAGKATTEKPTLLILADRMVSYENLVRLTQIARTAGIESAVLATLPGPFTKAIPPPGRK